MVCLTLGEFELMALVGAAYEGIVTRAMEQIVQMFTWDTIVLYTDNPAALGFLKRNGASRRTRHVDTKVYFMQA